MTTNRLGEYLEFANLQMAAEAFLTGLPADTNLPEYKPLLADRLISGNGHAGAFPLDIARQFSEKYEVVDHKANTRTGFSGTLFRNRLTGELTLSFRSTEFIDDNIRDSKATNELEIRDIGWAFGQIADMEEWYWSLKANSLIASNASLNVTGYSLGGHLATAFAILRNEQGEGALLGNIYTFNGAGVGGLVPGKRLTDVVARFVRMRDDPASIDWTGFSDLDRAFIFSQANSRVQEIIAEQTRLSGFTQTAFNPPLQTINDQVLQKDLAYQVAALLAAMDTVPSSQFFASDVNTIPTSRIFASTRFANMTELYGSDGGRGGASFVAFSGIHYGANSFPVYIEDQPLFRGNVLGALTLNLLRDNPAQNDFGDTHSLVLLVDSLSVMSCLASLDSQVSQLEIERILRASSNAAASSLLFTQGTAEGDTLERVLSALGRLTGASSDSLWTIMSPSLMGNSWWQPDDNSPNSGDTGRRTFHSNLAIVAERIKSLTSNASVQFRIAPLDTWNAEDLAAAAMAPDGVAYRYALKEGNPFAVIGAVPVYDDPLYKNFDRISASRGLTDSEIQDRAAMLAWSILRNQENKGPLFITSRATTFAHFVDARPDEKMPVLDFRVAPEAVGNVVYREIRFGAEFVDVLNGGDAADRLYGDAGTDYLRAAGLNDYVEGGVGLDIYAYAGRQDLFGMTNNGDDIIFDTDGKGVLRSTFRPVLGPVRTTVIADAAKKLNDTTWFSSDDRFKFEKVFPEPGRTDLVVTILGDAGGTLTLKDFRDGDFAIRLRQPRLAPNYGDPTNTVPGGDDGRNSLAGTPAGDLIEAFGENDTVSAGAGNDLVFGGSDDDLLFGQDGDDRMQGDSGRDTLDGGPGADELSGGPGVDILSGRAGSDLLIGEDGADLLAGDEGADEIFSGSRNALANAMLLAESEVATGRKGEWLDGGEDDDVLVAGADNDQLMGGGGADVMVGGAGDDNLIGDWGRILVHVDNWAVTRQTLASGSSIAYQLAYNGEAQVSEMPDGTGDWMYGGAGVDWIFGGAGDDFVDAGSGDDIVLGEAGADILLGGSGNDVLSGDNPGVVPPADEAGDYLDGGAGDDTLQGNGGDDVLVGGPGADVLVGGAGKDLYLFEKGDALGDVIIDAPMDASSEERSELILGEGITRSQIKFFPGSLGIDFGPTDPSNPNSAHETLHIQGFNPLDPFSTPVIGALRFADGSSMTFDDILAQGFDVEGTEGSDNEQYGGTQLHGTAVVDRIRGLGGHDLLFGFAGADTLWGGDGNDALLGDQGDDVLFGDAGTDSLWGGAGSDSLEGGTENDVLYGNEGADTLDGGAGNDTLYGHVFAIVNGVPMLNPLDDDAADVLRGGDGDDHLNSGGGADLLQGDGGNDYQEADGGDDSLEGGAGNDTLIGGDGNDLLAGGSGADWLLGGPGDDSYLFNAGDEHDVISDGGLDTVTFGEGTASADLHLWKTGADLVISNAAETDTWTIANWYAGTQYQMHEFRFADGSAWTAEHVGSEAAKEIRGTTGDDIVAGTDIDETLSGLAGNDQLFGNAGADTLLGGLGDDMLSGGSGADSYRFELGDGRDVIQESGVGSDSLLFGAGITKASVSPSRAGNDLVLVRTGSTDSVTIKDWFSDVTKQVESIGFATGEFFTPAELTVPFLTLTGTAGNDVLFGGNAYSETIFGLAGDDELHGGGGADSIIGGRGNDRLYGEDDLDRYFFAAGDGQDVIIDWPGSPWIQFGPGLADKVSVVSSGLADWLITFAGTTDSVLVKAGGNFPSLSFELYGTESADTLSGSPYQDLVFASGGNDYVKGNDGLDEIHGGPGNDTLEGGLHIDELWGDEGDDVLDGDRLNDPLQTEGGRISRFHGGPGNDTIYGSTAGDSYFFDLGDGQDTIYDEPYFNVLWYFSWFDEINFGPGIAADTLGAHASGNDLVIDVNAADHITVKSWYGGSQYRIDSLRFSDGSSLNDVQIGDLVNVRQGTTGNDVLTGSDTGNERMYGKAGNDTIAGLGGNDLLDGGPGNDVLDGGLGNDTFVIRPGEGSEFLRDAGGADTIRFGEGASAATTSLERSGDNLVLRLLGGSDTVTVENYLKTPASWIETILFADGSSLPDSDTIVDQLIAVRGTDANDTLSGTIFSDRLYGMDGNDNLAGGAGDDTLSGDAGTDVLAGGAGNDLLLGGAGADRYQFNAGDGSDTIADADAGNLILFGAGITPAGVNANRTADDLLLAVSGMQDRITIPNYFIGYPIAEFRFADGTVWTSSTIKMKVTTATSGPDTLIGFESNDSLNGLAGADTIYGRAGDDILDGGLGSDMIYGEDGNDTLIGGAGESTKAIVANSLYGGAGDDVLVAGGNAKSAERLDGGAGADLLLGGAAGEFMEDTGYDGRNTLFLGGSAADTIRMYGGAAAIAIGGADNDQITGGQGQGVQKTQMVVAHNKADGIDTVDQLALGSTLSIGGGTLYSNLSLEVTGTGLRVKTGSNTYVSLSDWYSTAPGAGGKAVFTLQVVIDGTKDYKPTSANPINNAKVVAFDFLGLVAAFDSARAAGQPFTVATALPNFRMWSSNTDAIGGPIAYQYAKTGSLGTLTYEQMRGAINSPALASVRQTITPAAMALAEQAAIQDAGDAPVGQSQPMSGVAQAPAAQVPAPGEDTLMSAAPIALPSTRAVINADSVPDPVEKHIAALLKRAQLRVESFFDVASAESDPAQQNAAAWRRIAQHLTAHLEDPVEKGIALPGRSHDWTALATAENAVPVIPLVGIADTGRNALRTFDGLKEGFAMLT